MAFEVREITSQLASKLILTKHYAQRMPQVVYAFGLFENSEYVGCVSYGKPATPQVAKSVCPQETNIVYELNRLVITSETKNAASFLVGQSLSKLPHGLIIVSYADGAVGHVGYIYQATNFFYAGSVKAHDAEYIWNGKKYHPRVLNHMGINNPTQWAKEVGAEKLPIIAKHRYVITTGSAQQKKNALKKVSWSFNKEYPKGETTRHSVGGLTQLAPDKRDSAPSQSFSTPEAFPAQGVLF
jgi:hypothetical protein